MAWNVRWQVQFRSLKGTDYTVNISEQDWTGGVTQLTPSDQPFTTQEDDDDDVFKPIRAQSGYLRVIDATGDLLESLMPENNTQRLVQLMVGTAIKWQGFLQADAYTQPWLEGKVEIELPLKSVLGALEDVVIEAEYFSIYKNVAFLFVQAFTNLGIEPSNVYVGGDLSNKNSLWTTYINLAKFFTKTEILNGNAVDMEMVGDSYSEVLERVMQLFGLTMREQDGNIYLIHYDTNTSLQVSRYTWQQIVNAANGQTPTKADSEVNVDDLMDSIEFRDDNTEMGFVMGGKAAVVKLDVDTGDIDMIELPKTDETADPTFDVRVANGGNVVIQAHPARNNGIETFRYWESREHISVGVIYYDGSTISYWDAVASTYAALWQHLMLRTNHFSTSIEGKQGQTFDTPFYTGAIPVRWGQKNENDTFRLQNGMLLVQEALNNSNPAPHLTDMDMYSIKTPASVQLSTGFININFRIDNFYNMHPSGAEADFGGHSDNNDIRCKLRVGNMWWNGTAWTPTEEMCHIIMEGAEIDSNKTSDMNVDEERGWFIPITTDMAGVVEFTILNSVNDTSGAANNMQTVHKILTNLEVKFLYPANMIASTRNSNTYRQRILTSGFSEEKQIDLEIGTFNNNLNSFTFINNANNEHIESFTYRGNVTERPEEHLLNRMVAQYQRARCRLTAGIQTDLDVMRTVYDKDGKRYFGINADINYRDDKASMKFIEVNQP